MLDSLLSTIAPHPCCQCGKIGGLLCEHCKYNIVNEAWNRCIMCGVNNNKDSICTHCQLRIQRGWCVGERTEALQRLIDAYKFENAKAAHAILADMLDGKVPILPDSTVVVPIPTIAAHIRQRGYDHAGLLARSFARKRGLAYQPVVRRRTNTSQRNAFSRKQRLAQAKEAFIVTRLLSPNRPYLLVDDIVTTGATLTYAAEALYDKGASQVWVAVVARQPLD